MVESKIRPSRRSFLLGVGATGLLSALPINSGRAGSDGVVKLSSKPTQFDILAGAGPITDVWAYNGRVPGPELRVRQGERLRVRFENGIPQESTVHWHGMRIPNAMDGVPGLTQKPVPSGGAFDYEFTPPDAGTYWYHPHVKSSEQLGRGLYGPLIIEEAEPPKVDRDVTWVIDDWRIDQNGAIDESFHDMHDMSHSGRLGNVAALNGVSSDTFSVRAGERIRLRLINVANARVFALNFADHEPVVIALDGHPVDPFAPANGRIVLASGQRADLILDMSGKPGQVTPVVDNYYSRSTYKFLDLVYDNKQPIREIPLDAPVRLPSNPLAEPSMADAKPMALSISGGAMGGMREARFKGKSMGIRELVGLGKVWAINGEVFDPTSGAPMFTVKKGSTQRLVISNETSWPHPMHLHGHAFKIIARNGKKAEREIWTDTVFLDPDEQVEALFVADNPGDWLFHCHILEHHEAGMATVVRVS